MNRGVRLACAALVVAALSSCSRPPGNALTDREAAEVVRRISSPRQGTADGLVRAAVGTDGANPRLQVIEAENLRAKRIDDALARLVFRIAIDGKSYGGTFGASQDPVTACYEARFNYYGVIGSPRRIDCPRGATPIVPTPLGPMPRTAIPSDYDQALAEILEAVPAAPTAGDLNARVVAGLPESAVDPSTGLTARQPAVETSVSGSDIGVSLWALEGRNCVLGARISGKITVWRPSRVQLQPGELSCDPQTALQLAGVRPPH